MAARHPTAAVAVPVLDQTVDGSIWLWPQVRNRDPVVASFVGADGTPVASDLSPATVAGVLADVW